MSKQQNKSRQTPLSQKVYRVTTEKPISKVYPTIDNDLARDNLENDLTEADRQDL